MTDRNEERMPVNTSVLGAVQQFAARQAKAWQSLADALLDASVAAKTVEKIPVPPVAATPPVVTILTDVGVAARLGVSVYTVRAWRRKGLGPQYHKFGRAVRYRSTDVAAYMERAGC